MRTEPAFHTYSDDDLEGEYGEPAQSPTSTKGFLLILSEWSYGGGCGGEASGVWEFAHMLHALKYVSSAHCDAAERHLDDDEADAWNATIDAAIQTIRAAHSDRGVDPGVLAYDGDRVGLSVGASGYWHDFVPSALDDFASYYEDELAQEADDAEDDTDGGGAEEQDAGDEPSDVRTALQAVQALQARQDLDSTGFLAEFRDVCDTYDELRNTR